MCHGVSSIRSAARWSPRSGYLSKRPKRNAARHSLTRQLAQWHGGRDNDGFLFGSMLSRLGRTRGKLLHHARKPAMCIIGHRKPRRSCCCVFPISSYSALCKLELGRGGRTKGTYMVVGPVRVECWRPIRRGVSRLRNKHHTQLELTSDPRSESLAESFCLHEVTTGGLRGWWCNSQQPTPMLLSVSHLR